MKITVLSLEDLSETQKDVVVPADLPEDELQDMKDEAVAAEEETAQAAERAEEQTESQSLIDQVVALEALYDKIGSMSTFPAELAMEAYDAAPDAYIMETYRSGASTGAKISVAMEGVLAKAWEGVKRFWAQLVQIWKKCVQYIDRFINGAARDELKVDQTLVNACEALLHEGAQRFQHNQTNGMLVRDNPEEYLDLKRAWVHSGAGQLPEAIAKIKELLPKANQFIQISQKFSRDLETWATESIRHPNAQTVMPASPASTMYDFVEACEGLNKSVRHFFLTKEYNDVKRVPFNSIVSQLKSIVVTAEYGLERALGDAARGVAKFAEKRNEELGKKLEKENIDATVSKVYRALGQELTALRKVVMDVFMLFGTIHEAQARALRVGDAWIYAVYRAYEEMVVSGKEYSDQDKDQFRKEEKYFKELWGKYLKLTDRKASTTTRWA